MIRLDATTGILMGGIPALNAAVYHRIRFMAHDPTAVIQLSGGDGPPRTLLIIRDIEMERAREQARADVVACPADFAPATGLSGDRETATAQAAAECLRQNGITSVIADRSLPLLFAHIAKEQGIDVGCDSGLGVIDRRSKDAQEVEWLRQAQQDTEHAMEMACRMVGGAEANGDGILTVHGEPLTSERVRAAIDHFLLDRGYSNPPSIIASGPEASDCHQLGSGPIRTGQPVIIDIFPRNKTTCYNGDCTRTVVHGTVPDSVHRMHQAVMDAKWAAESATRTGVSGEAVHQAAGDAILRHGFSMGLPKDGDPPTYCGMTHGTGHGIGLEIHEPPLLDRLGPTLVEGDALTIEPGLYCREIGGVRVEDMVIVSPDGCENLNTLPTGLTWT